MSVRLCLYRPGAVLGGSFSFVVPFNSDEKDGTEKFEKSCESSFARGGNDGGTDDEEDEVVETDSVAGYR